MGAFYPEEAVDVAVDPEGHAEVALPAFGFGDAAEELGFAKLGLVARPERGEGVFAVPDGDAGGVADALGVGGAEVVAQVLVDKLGAGGGGVVRAADQPVVIAFAVVRAADAHQAAVVGHGGLAEAFERVGEILVGEGERELEQRGFEPAKRGWRGVEGVECGGAGDHAGKTNIHAAGKRLRKTYGIGCCCGKFYLAKNRKKPQRAPPHDFPREIDATKSASATGSAGIFARETNALKTSFFVSYETTASKTKSPEPTTDYTNSTDTYPNHDAFIRAIRG